MATGGGPYSTHVQYADGRSEYVDLPSNYQAGDVLAITRRRDGGVIAQRVSYPVISGSCASFGYGASLGGTTYFKFYVKRGGGYGSNQSVTLRLNFANIPDETYELNPSVVGTTWTEIILGPFVSAMFENVTISGNYSNEGCSVYFDDLKFTWTGGSWNLGGRGGFETGDDDWNMTGSAEITTDEANEGSHSLMLL